MRKHILGALVATILITTIGFAIGKYELVKKVAVPGRVVGITSRSTMLAGGCLFLIARK